jgi:4-hydroxy-3-methylbut-2-enyl diphosphate reductase
MLKVIEIDPSAGFCFGVDKAIEAAEKNLEQGIPVYGLGSMVHNQAEMKRLEELGLKTIDINGLKEIKEGKVIFRAHGEPPQTYSLTSELNLEVIDATCPIVLKLQQKIRKKYLELDHKNEEIVIFGKVGHPETIGLLGQTENTAVLLTDPNNLKKIDWKKKIYLFSQTTMDPSLFDLLEKNLLEFTKVSGDNSLNSNCSICKQMKSRKPNLKKFAKNYEMMIFVSGKDSSNGKMLFEFCKTINPNTIWIQNPQEISYESLANVESVGISGATSTSVWQLEEIKAHIESLTAG